MKLFGKELKFNNKDVALKENIPTTLPANGGNADTVDGKHASDFSPTTHTHNKLVHCIGIKNTSGDFTNQYTKVATFNITSQYGYVASSYMIIAGGHGQSTTQHCILNVWIKCQQALGQDGIIKLTIADKTSETLDAFDFYIVEILKSSTKNTYELYLKNKSGWTNGKIFELGYDGTSSNFTYHTESPYVASLPSGRNIVSIVINNKHTHTKGQITDFPTIPTKMSQLENDIGAGGGTTIITSVNRPSGQVAGRVWIQLI